MAAGLMAAALMVTLQGTSWVGPSEAPLKITFEEGRAHGALSCNSFHTAYEAGEATLGFGSIATTRKACAPPRMQQDSQVLKFLEQTVSYSVDGDELVLKDGSGSEVLRLKRKI
jgi:heat shock protein HslJ